MVAVLTVMTAMLIAAPERSLEREINTINVKLGLQRLSGKDPQFVVVNFRSHEKELMDQISNFYLDENHWPIDYKIKVFKSDVPRRLSIVQMYTSIIDR